jgi:hypothetical protein
MKSPVDAALIDITECAQDPEIKASGWRVAISPQAMELCMTIPWTDAHADHRLAVMLCYLWDAIKHQPAVGEYLAGLGIAVNHTSVFRADVDVSSEPGERILLGAFATIGPKGLPTVIVLSADEAMGVVGPEPVEESGQSSPLRKGEHFH